MKITKMNNTEKSQTAGNDFELKSAYRSTMEEIQTSDELTEKLLSFGQPDKVHDENGVGEGSDKEMEVIVRRNRILKRIGIAAAVFVVTILFSNVVAYATTGTAWLELLWGDIYDNLSDVVTQGGTFPATAYKALPFRNKSGEIEYHQIAYGYDENGNRVSQSSMSWVSLDGDTVELDPDGIATEVSPELLGEITAVKKTESFDMTQYMNEEDIAKSSSVLENGILTIEYAEIYVNGEQAEIIYNSSTSDGLLTHVAEYRTDSEVYLIAVAFLDEGTDIRVFLGEAANLNEAVH